MPFYEARAMRDGIEVPIHCLALSLKKAEGTPNLHYHDYSELLYGTRGTVRVFVGSESFYLNEGDLIVIHTNVPHTVQGVSETGEYTVVKFLPEILISGEQTYRECAYALLLLENSKKKQIFFSSEELAETSLRQMFENVIAEWQAQEFGYELSIRATVTQIFLHILRTWRKKHVLLIPENTRHRELLESAFRTIRENLACISEEEVAQACGVSRSYFSRVFGDAMQTGFSAYVQNLRLIEAERLLLTTSMSMTDIAATVGFSTTSHFISRFRERNAVTPLQYRKLHAKA